MTVRNKGIKTLRTNGNLGRVLPNKDGVALFVMNGVAVSSGAQLGVLYNIQDLATLLIDAAYDTANKLLVYHHISRAMLRNPNLEGYFFLCPQKVSSTEITPDVMCDKDEPYAATALAAAKTAGIKIKLLTVAYNPSSTYSATITGGMDATGALAKAKLQELLQDQEDDYKFINASLEARSFSGTISDLVAVEALSSNLDAPRVRFVIAADPAVMLLDALYEGYAAVGDELGMMSKAAVSENYGNPIDKFNLINVANAAFITPGLSGNNALPTDNALLNSLEEKGYIFAETVSEVDGLYFNDTFTCVPADDDYRTVEYNRVVDKVLLIVKRVSTPMMLNARLEVDTTSGELTIAQKTMIEDACVAGLEQMLKDGDISGGIECQIPAEINVLAGDEIYIDSHVVPKAIGRKITVRAGLNNPFA